MGRGGYLGGSTIIRSWPSRSRSDVKPQKPRKTASASAASPALRAKLRTKVEQQTKPRTEAKAPRHTSASVKGRADRATSVAVNAVEAAAYILTHHPSCPKANRIAIAARVGRGSWPGVTLPQAVAICMEKHASDDVCGLHRLVQSGLARPAAARLIEPAVRALLFTWSSRPVRLDRRAAP